MIHLVRWPVQAVVALLGAASHFWPSVSPGTGTEKVSEFRFSIFGMSSHWLDLPPEAEVPSRLMPAFLIGEWRWMDVPRLRHRRTVQGSSLFYKLYIQQFREILGNYWSPVGKRKLLQRYVIKLITLHGQSMEDCIAGCVTLVAKQRPIPYQTTYTA